MKFQVYRKTSTGFKLLGTTFSLVDAKNLLRAWASGYITDSNGKVVVEKNM